MSSAEQRKTIGYFRKLNGIDEDLYREMLLSYGVASSKDLTDGQAENFIQRLKKSAAEVGTYKPKKEFAFNKYRHHDCAGRKGMATPAQLRKIEAMFFCVSRKETDAERKKALDRYCERITSKSSIKFLTLRDVAKVIKALENTKK